MTYDCVIIGKGPSGVSAAIYLARANKSVLVIGKDYGSIEAAKRIDNYYGVESINGVDLAKSGENQAKNFGAEFKSNEVTSIEYGADFIVKTKTEEYNAKTVLIATGKPKKKINVKGFDEFVGKGISFCAVCDGFLYRGKHLALIGCGDYAAHEYENLLNFTTDITVFANGEETISEKFKDAKIIKEKITEIIGEGKAEKIVTETAEYEADGIFVAVGTADSVGFSKTLGILTKNENICVDENMMTNIDGIFAAGDCIGGFLQVVTAAADGAKASVGILNYLKGGK